MQLKTALLSTAVAAALAGLGIYSLRSGDAAAMASTDSTAAVSGTAASASSASAPAFAPRSAHAQTAIAQNTAAMRALIDTSARPGSQQAWASSSPDQADRTSAAERARGLLATVAAREVNLARNDGFIARDVMIDRDGTEHVRMERSYEGLPVIGGDMVVHSRNGELLSVTQGNNMRTTARPQLKPALSAAQALAEASGHFDGRVTEVAPATLVVYARNGMQPTLAYQVGLAGERRDDQTPGVFSYFLDAGTGALLEAEDRVHAAGAIGTAKTLTLGEVSIASDAQTTSKFDTTIFRQVTKTVYSLIDSTRGGNQTFDANNGKDINASVVFSDSDNVWGDGTTGDRATAATDVHYGVAATWDYFKSVHSRNGLKNDGKGINSYVHFGKNYLNAAFVPSASGYMVYGDGDSTNGFKPLVALETVAHELGHGLTNATARLGYYGIKDSGGLDEGSSDIFAVLVEYSLNNAKDPGDWLIGENFTDGPVPHWAMRRMFDQASDGRSFNCYPAGGFTAALTKMLLVEVEVAGRKELRAKANKYDPHFTSGVTNRFAYLLSEGAVAPAGFPEYTPERLVCNNDTAIVGIGKAKLGAIWYRALTKYFVASTDFPGARKGTLQAAADLYGADSVEYKTVAQAWSAVNVD